MNSFLSICTLFLFSCASATELPQSLKKAEYLVCGQKMLLEIADSEQSRQKGLMGREKIEPGTGMLFVFDLERPLSFWMKNVPFDIEIGFFDSKKKLVSWKKMLGTSPLQIESALPSYASEKPALYAIEVPVGFFKTNVHSAQKCSFKKIKN